MGVGNYGSEQTLSEVYEGLYDYERARIHNLIGEILSPDFALLYSTMSRNEKIFVRTILHEAVNNIGVN